MNIGRYPKRSATTPKANALLVSRKRPLSSLSRIRAGLAALPGPYKPPSTPLYRRAIRRRIGHGRARRRAVLAGAIAVAGLMGMLMASARKKLRRRAARRRSVRQPRRAAPAARRRRDVPVPAPQGVDVAHARAGAARWSPFDRGGAAAQSERHLDRPRDDAGAHGRRDVPHRSDLLRARQPGVVRRPVAPGRRPACRSTRCRRSTSSPSRTTTTTTPICPRSRRSPRAASRSSCRSASASWCARPAAASPSSTGGRRRRSAASASHCVPAQHFSGRSLTDGDTRLWAGWVVAGPTRRFYHAGDTGYFAGLRTHRRAPRPDRPRGAADRRLRPGARSCSFVHMNPEEAIQAALDLRADDRGRHALRHVRSHRRAARRAAAALPRRGDAARPGAGGGVDAERRGDAAVVSWYARWSCALVGVPLRSSARRVRATARDDERRPVDQRYDARAALAALDHVLAEALRQPIDRAGDAAVAVVARREQRQLALAVEERHRDADQADRLAGLIGLGEQARARPARAPRWCRPAPAAAPGASRW